MHFSLATCRDLPELSTSDSLLADELRRRGHGAEAFVWNGDSPPRMPETDVVILRSTWDFHRQLADYVAWLEAIDASTTTLLNPIDLVRWNLEKTYLVDLADRGAPVPRLAVVDDVADAPSWTAGRAVVVKPTVGASGVGVERVEAGRLADHRHVGPVIVQEFVEDVGGGEWALVFLGGEYSHAFQRVPAAGEFRVNGGYGGVTRAGDPDPPLIGLAAELHAMLPVQPVYARIDLTITAAGPVVMEVEVNEPSICLHLHPDAPARFADAVLSA